MVNILVKVPHSRREYIITSNEFQYILNEVKKGKKHVFVSIGEGDNVKVKAFVIDHIRTMSRDDVVEIIREKLPTDTVFEIEDIRKYYSAIAYGTIAVIIRYLVEREPKLSDSTDFEQLGHQYAKMHKLLDVIAKKLQ